MKLNTDNYNKVYVVGDLHGCYTELMAQLEVINFNKGTDLLVSVGDLVDRGTENLECLSLLYEPWFVSVLGNHEDFMVQSILNNDNYYIQNWIYNGGSWYLSLTHDKQLELKDYCEYIRDIVPTILLLGRNNSKVLICHGDYPLDFYNNSVIIPKDDIIWNRDRITKVQSDKDYTPIVKDVDLCIFGHTPLKDVVMVGNCMWIDTGAVFNDGKLTIVDLDGVLNETHQ